MSKFPYAGLPAHQIWKRGVSDIGVGHVDPQVRGRYSIPKTAPIASAGSCFAQRIATALRSNGYSYLVTEPGPIERNYGRYSARYGDIYTALQLAQLARRCIGDFAPTEPAWRLGERFHDPFRPRVEPGGFGSLAELEADRARHLAAVRRMFCQSDFFVFTLGLTETWCSRADGAVFPLCPGAGIGSFDPQRYAYCNLSVEENIAAIETFLEIAWSLNPALRVLFTISPVPLAATMEDRHVVSATAYSKAVLRVVAETMRARHERVDYFASYEIATCAFDGQPKFGPDGRDVLDSTVERVMDSFFANFGETPQQAQELPTIELSMAAVMNAPTVPRSPNDPCDEAYLASFIAKA